jgi:hypothetical protein
MGMKEGPILTKWHKDKNPKEEEISRFGFVSSEVGKEEGVRRKTFQTPVGEQKYAYKEVLNGLDEAEKTMRIYKKMKDVGVPVVSFAKILRKKNEEGEFEYEIAMEDLTEGGKLSVVESHSEFSSYELPLEMEKEMLRTLARIHNLGIVHEHPGISFVLQCEEEGGGKRAVRFRVIDYANFAEASDIEREVLENDFYEGKNVESIMEAYRLTNLGRLLYRLNAVGSLATVLEHVYREELKKKEHSK